MSKSFIKEETDAGDGEEPSHLKIPSGAKNYITPAGFARLKEELHDLLYKKRPEMTATVAWAAGNGDRSENADYLYGKRRLREIDRRIRFLTKRLEISEVIDPTKRAEDGDADQVFFGATVTVQDEELRSHTYAIVGVDEIDLTRNHISWTSPLARALFKSRPGDVVTFQSPKGPREVEVLAVAYQEIEPLR